MGGERQIGDLFAEVKGQGGTGRHHGLRPVFFHTGNCSIEVVGRFDAKRQKRDPEIASRQVLQFLLDECRVINRAKDSHTFELRHDFLEDLQPFREVSSAASLVMPVMFPPGCARLWTSPSSTGNPIDMNTVGTPLTNFLAAIAASPQTTNRSTCGSSDLMASSILSGCGPANRCNSTILRSWT